MNRLKQQFEILKRDDRKALIPFITAGDPDSETTLQLVKVLEDAGADIIELGLPYSDPLADGPVLQRAANRALAKGMDTEKYFELIEELREKTDLPLVCLAYVNSLLQYGWEKFGRRAQEAGLDAVIIPDLPREARYFDGHPLPPLPITEIRLVAPTSRKRVKTIACEAEGFLYCIASRGVTGARKALSEDLKDFMNLVRKEASCPTALGFGISTPEMVRQIRDFADGFIIGSALVEKLEKDQNSEEPYKEAAAFISSLRKALDESSTGAASGKSNF